MCEESTGKLRCRIANTVEARIVSFRPNAGEEVSPNCTCQLQVVRPGASRTSRRPDSNRRAQGQLPPASRSTGEELKQSCARLAPYAAADISCSKPWQDKTQRSAGEVCGAPRKIIEALRMSCNRWNSDGPLNCKGKSNSRHDGAEDRILESRGAKNTG